MRAPYLKFLFLFLFVATFSGESRAGSWAPPHDFEVLSANGEHRVTVHAPNKASGGKSHFVVESKIADQWKKKWEQTVVNEIMPHMVVLNDSGSRVISLGNWFGRETGNDSLVVYSEDGALAQYSVAELSHPEALQPLSSAGSAWLMDSHSGFDENLGFYLWLDYARKWSVIDLSAGQLRKLTPKLVRQCEDLARVFLFSWINSGEPNFSNYKLLSRFMRPDDKELFESLLTHSGENLGCGARHQGNKTSADYGLLEYYHANRYRDLAETALDALAGGASDADYPQGRIENYKRLGSIKLTAKFDQLPKKEEGIIVVWLEPVAKKGIALVRNCPAHAIGIDLHWQAPERYGINPRAPKNTLPINFHGVTPGSYRVRGFWNQKVKSSHEIDKDFWTRTGETKVIDVPMVEVRKSGIATAEIVFERLKRD